jgi:hypothetical protein
MRQNFFLTLASIFVFQPSFAASPIGNVGTAKVDAGEFNIEQRIGFTRDDKSSRTDQRLQMRQHFDYGVNDWYALRFNIAQDRRNGENMGISSYTIENRFQLIEARDHGFDAGFRIIYGHRTANQSPDEIDVRLMAMGTFGEHDEWAWRHNTVMEHDIGNNSTGGLMLEWRHQLVREIDHGVQGIKKWQVGAEIFNDIGRTNQQSGFERQDHQIGPVTKISFNNGVYAQAGYRYGVSDSAADHLFKVFLGAKF